VVEGEKGKPFMINETGWGEFEITMKLYYVPDSGEKPQTLYHHLRLHPFGRTEEEKESMRLNGEVISWVYEEQIFNEPYDAFYEILTSGALPPTQDGKAGASKNKSGGGKSKEKDAKGQTPSQQPQRSEGGVLERSAMIPLTNRPGQPFSRETEQLEIRKLKEAMVKVEQMTKQKAEELKKKEQRLQELKAEAAKAAKAN